MILLNKFSVPLSGTSLSSIPIILLRLFFRSFSSGSFIFGCSGLAFVGSLGFTGIVLLFVVLHVFLPF